MTVQRHRTAIGRVGLSRPIQLAIASGLLHPQATVLDYGCGRGGDVRTLTGLGYNVEGWDPVHLPDGECRASELVNLGYVVNVIEDPSERTETLKIAWGLAERVLVVAARVDFQAGQDFEECADGVLTGRGTFQKFYAQSELRDWIDGTLDVLSVAAGPGIFFVFREEQDRQRFSSALFRRRLSAPIARVSDELFDEHREKLSPLIEFFEARGRIPQPEEISNPLEIAEIFGSNRRAFRVVRNATGDKVWNEIEDQRTDDVLVYLALQRFRKRPRLSELPLELRYDVKAFFGNYKAACAEADALLFSTGNTELLSESAKSAGFGKLTPEALYLHGRRARSTHSDPPHS